MATYGAGLFGAIFHKKWKATTQQDAFIYVTPDQRRELGYPSIRQLRQEKGLIWQTLVIKTNDDELVITGLSKGRYQSLAKDLEHRIKTSISEHLQNHHSHITSIVSQVDVLLDEDRYLSNTEVKQWLYRHDRVGEWIAHPMLDISYFDESLRPGITRILDLLDSASTIREERNARWIELGSTRFDDFFAQLEKYPLSDEQKRAVMIDEDRNLLVAAAGSGKSSTIVAKALFTIKRQLARPSEILVLAFNKDAQEEIDARLQAHLGTFPEYQTPVTAKTFHGLGLEIITASESKKPSISSMATGTRDSQQRQFMTLVEGLLEQDSEFATDWLTFLTVSNKPDIDTSRISTQSEYNDYLVEVGGTRRHSSTGVEVVFTTINGIEVKSFEELRIANWLVIQGVTFNYEKPYEFDTATEVYRQYYPDFYYPDVDIYHEHFAINHAGKAPKWMDADKYEEGVRWKRKLHKEHATRLIETHSAHFHDDTVFDHLDQLLKEHNVPRKPLSSKQLTACIKDSFDPDKDIEIFLTFLRHFKANDASMVELQAKSETMRDKHRTRLFLRIFQKLYQAYQHRLSSNNEIDFQDQINKACRYIKAGKYTHPYKYILVDEFQDISQDRMNLLHALLQQDESIKLFAVGDDWQSIYRFAGADIYIMTHFSQYFGVTSQNYLTNTFRSYQGIVDVASQFIQVNDNQLRKTVHAFEDYPGDLVRILPYKSASDQVSRINQILGALNALAAQRETRSSVFLLGRYHYLKPKNLPQMKREHPNLTITFRSIHASKGLETDYVILMGLEAGNSGFPSNIADDPLLSLVIPEPETFEHAEERRLMYVALTRAKRAVFALVSELNASVFAKELATYPRVQSGATFVERTPCPKCGDGELLVREGKYGKFLGCSNYPSCKHNQAIESSNYHQINN